MNFPYMAFFTSGIGLEMITTRLHFVLLCKIPKAQSTLNHHIPSFHQQSVLVTPHLQFPTLTAAVMIAFQDANGMFSVITLTKGGSAGLNYSQHCQSSRSLQSRVASY